MLLPLDDGEWQKYKEITDQPLRFYKTAFCFYQSGYSKMQCTTQKQRGIEEKNGNDRIKKCRPVSRSGIGYDLINND
ncbi:hypothetical protein [Hafnia alvei]|uniref:hypothetical protein n=1 Tax=Hafnia alvei TaxID=569 RepID=UPI0006210CB2|nr:hypothetical protein [Hafnia alvei]KKI42616.1 hypothetical protein XK86_16830 [Hafnia alvei]